MIEDNILGTLDRSFTMNSTVNISEQESKATSVFTAVEILLGATLLLTCVVFCQKSHLPTPTNVSIVILAISDILSTVVVTPFSLASFFSYSERWISGQIICFFNSHTIMALIGLTFISMTCTAVICYVSVVRPSLQRQSQSEPYL